jgi:hypothetical protein
MADMGEMRISVGVTDVAVTLISYTQNIYLLRRRNEGPIVQVNWIENELYKLFINNEIN